jgi:hypothetical protein
MSLALVGAIILAAAAIALAPAAALDRPLAMRTADRLRLVDARGFWWSGRGAIATADGAARVPLAWRIEPASLVRGALAIRLVGDAGDAPTGTITLDGGIIAVRAFHASMPAALVNALDSRLRSVALGGSVTLDAPSFTVRGADYTGTVNATWHDARVAVGDAVVSLGAVVLATAPAGERLAGTIRNSGGDVTIDGTLAGRPGALDATLALRPNATAPDAVRRLLPLLGAPDDGGVRIAWRSDR